MPNEVGDPSVFEAEAVGAGEVGAGIRDEGLTMSYIVLALHFDGQGKVLNYMELLGPPGRWHCM